MPKLTWANITNFVGFLDFWYLVQLLFFSLSSSSMLSKTDPTELRLSAVGLATPLCKALAHA